ncbi:hypothetical protein Mgra_00009667, partial [Meloidogyne graminicola]
MPLTITHQVLVKKLTKKFANFVKK